VMNTPMCTHNARRHDERQARRGHALGLRARRGLRQRSTGEAEVHGARRGESDGRPRHHHVCVHAAECNAHALRTILRGGEGCREQQHSQGRQQHGEGFDRFTHAGWG
jgi:hypothetical protein